MIVSSLKIEDMRLRSMILDVLEISIRHGYVDLAKEIGRHSAAIKHRIETNDYFASEKLLSDMLYNAPQWPQTRENQI